MLTLAGSAVLYKIVTDLGTLSLLQKQGYSVYPCQPLGAIVTKIFINPEHYTSKQLLFGVLLLGVGRVFKHNISLSLKALGVIIP
jgi:hypothetical protein